MNIKSFLLNQFEFAPVEYTDFIFFNLGENDYIVGIGIFLLIIYLVFRLYKKLKRTFVKDV